MSAGAAGPPGDVVEIASAPARSAAADRLGAAVVVLLLAVFAAQATAGIVSSSATWDETNYFGMGDYLLRAGRWDVPSSILHPPLGFYLASVPVLFADVGRQVWEYPATGSRDLAFLGAADLDRGRALLSSPANRGDRLLIASRLMVVLQALLLGWFVFGFARRLYGRTAGLLALFFFAFCPNMIAQAGLITPDMTVTVFTFITVYYLREALESRTRRAFVLAGVALGLALLSKFTALLLLPVAGALLGMAFLRRRRVPLRPLLVALGCALLVFLAAYRFDPTPYLRGIEVQQGFTARGQSSFLMGEISTTGWWYYCLVAFALKTPIPLLLLLLAAAGLSIARAIKGSASLDDLFLWLPVVTTCAFFSVELRSIGLRYVLPVYPFVFVLAAGAAARARRLWPVAAALMIWYAAGTFTVRPSYLAYFNEIAGGPDNGYKYLVDSNLDWGQDLKGLKTFMDQRGIDRVYLSYFGSDSPERYGIAYDWLPSYELRNPHPQAQVLVARKRYLAISATNLQGVYLDPPTMFRWLDRYQPVARIGHSIFVYYLQ